MDQLTARCAGRSLYSMVVVLSERTGILEL